MCLVSIIQLRSKEIIAVRLLKIYGDEVVSCTNTMHNSVNLLIFSSVY